MNRFAIGAAEAGGPRLLVVAGPCVVEDAELCLRTGERLRELCAARGLPYVFKASYRKANRSSGRAFAGLGRDEALAALARVRRELAVPVLTDVHEEAEVAAAAEVADALQIPAFLSRQTGLLAAAARTGRAVNVKKGQFLAPADMRQVVDKLAAAGGARILLTERGTTFGYGDLVVDMRGLVVMRELGWPVLYDATHSLQRPGGEETGGDRRFAFPLMRAAIACGVDGLFFEAHPEPARALSDAATQLPLEQAAAFLDEAVRVRDAVADPSRV
ncbi:MAG TPA: 3-deoxy-8-phosphooctulonate synthase [Candidatus Eisenbacteria bacterium]|nr:3-deoxy-8-phosphooctulonate synthase [Candidatus Eisenbacteria bacterium]